MPNTQTSVPAFTAGQVLTAAQMTEVNTGIPVFATTTTRDAAFGGTGEKTLAEGQFAYIEASNTTQYYDGSAWQTLVKSGLNFVTGATFSGVTSVSLPDGTFNSTYDNYKLIFQLTGVTGTTTITSRFRASGSDITTARYYQASVGVGTGGGADNNTQVAASSFNMNDVVNTTVNTAFAVTLDFYEPNINRNEKIALGSKLFHNGSGTYAAQHLAFIFDNNNVALQVDSFSIISSVASAMSGNYQVYGYSKS